MCDVIEDLGDVEAFANFALSEVARTSAATVAIPAIM